MLANNYRIYFSSNIQKAKFTVKKLNRYAKQLTFKKQGTLAVTSPKKNLLFFTHTHTAKKKKIKKINHLLIRCVTNGRVGLELVWLAAFWQMLRNLNRV